MTLLSFLGKSLKPKPLWQVLAELDPSQTYTGEATVYSVDSGAFGSCGNALDDSEFFVALSNTFMNNEYQSPYCGKTITVTNSKAPYSGINGVGNTVTVTVQDTCPSCSQDHLDLSVAAWNQLTDSSAFGTDDITW